MIKSPLSVLLLISVPLALFPVKASGQSLPARKSQTDQANNKQGKWVIWFNEQWKETKNPDSVFFYRKITYRDNRPLDLVQDYYRNGNLQWQGKLTSEGPPAVYNGQVSWYYESGQERIRAEFTNGTLTGGYKAWRKDGALVEGAWDAPVKEAENEEDRSRRLAFYLKARDNAEAIFTSHSVEYATQQENAAYEYLGAKEFEHAAAAFGDAVRLYVGLLPPEDERITDALDMLAYCFNRRGKTDAEREALTQLVALIDKFHGGYTANAASAWASLGDLSVNDPDLADGYFRKGYELLKTRTQTPDEFTQQRYVIYAYHNFLISRNEWQRAFQLNIESIDLTRHWAGEDSEMEIDLLIWRRNIELGLGNPSEAYQAAKRQFDLGTRLLPPDDPRIAGALLNMSDWELQSGRFAAAEEMLLSAEKIYLMHTPVTEPAYGTLLNKLVSFYHNFDREEKESRYAAAFLEFLMNTEGPGSRGVAQFHLEQAGHAMELRRLNEWAEHMSAFEKELNSNSAKKNLSPEHQQNLMSQYYLARSIFQLLRYQESRKLAQETIDQAERELQMKSANQILVDGESQMNKAIQLMSAKEHRTTLLLQQMMAVCKAMGGDLRSADEHILVTITGNKKYYGENSPEYCESVTFRAWIQKGLGHMEESKHLFAESFRNYREYCVRVAPYLSEAERQIFYNKLNGNLQEYFLFASENLNNLDPQTSGDLYNALLLSKSAGLDQLRNIRQQINDKNDTEALRLLNEWKGLKEQLIVVYRSGASDETSRKQTVLEDQVNRIERELAGRSRSFLDFNTQLNTDWKQVSSVLRPGEAAVEIIRIENAFIAKAFYAALVLKPDGHAPALVVLPNAIQLEKRNLRFYHNAIRNNLPDTISYSALWKPIAKAIGVSKHIYFSPDGLFNQVNLQTLKNPLTGKYLGEETDITLLTTTREIIRPVSREPLREVVMFGNPDFGSVGEMPASPESAQNRSASMFQVPDLPGTKAELDGLAQTFGQGKIKHRIFTRSEASEENIRKVSAPQVLHIATHGFFLNDVDRQSGGDFLQGFMGKQTTENPMLRSGLMLAGCRSATDRNSLSGSDGVLTAFEAASLDLTGNRMVVMSACETGLGTVINGEGVIGLPRALLSAGSEQVLMSLWKVDDQATQELMRDFYGRWAKTGDAESSWKLAQQDLRVKYPSPYYWGAFVLLR